jgi:hypothetical protein
MSDAEPEPAGTAAPADPAAPRARAPRWRRITVGVLVVLACILAPLSVVAVWLHNTLLDSSQYVETVGPLADDPDVQQAIANRVRNAVIERVDVQARVAEALPDRASFAAPAIAEAIDRLVYDTALRIVQSDQFPGLWKDANRRAHTRVVAVLKNEGSDNIDTANGKVIVELGPVADRVNDALKQRGITLFPDTGEGGSPQFVLLDSEQLRKAQRAVDLLDKLAVVLPIVTVAFLAIAVFLSPKRRRTVLRAGLGIAFAMALILIAFNLGRSFYLDALPSDVSQGAAASVYDQLLGFLRTSLRAGFTLGIVVALGAWLLGPGAFARRIRGGTIGLFSGHEPAPDAPPSPVADFVLRYRSALFVVTAAIGVAILVVLSHPGPVAVLTVTILVLLGLALIEGLSRRAGPRPGAVAT